MLTGMHEMHFLKISNELILCHHSNVYAGPRDCMGSLTPIHRCKKHSNIMLAGMHEMHFIKISNELILCHHSNVYAGPQDCMESLTPIHRCKKR